MVAVASVVALVILLAIASPFLRALRCYTDWASGEVAEGEVVKADPEVGLVLRFDDGQACSVNLGPTALEDFELGEGVMAVRRGDRPGECELLSTIEASRAFLTAFAALVVALLLLVLLTAIGLNRVLNQVPELTTRFDAGPLPCPRCQAPMEEGYLPLQSGVPWRRPDQPIGVAHAFHGLPGTAPGLRTRPRVHAYRCEPCEVVTFRYGRS